MAERIDRTGAGPVALVMSDTPKFVAEPRTLDAWAARAAPGAACLYARTARLPGGGVGERARQMHARGMVQLVQGRDPEHRGLFAYRAVRTAAPFAPPAPKPVGRLSPDDERVLDLVAGAADAGERCPTNRTIAARLGLKAERKAHDHLTRLRVAGAIRVFYADDGQTPTGVRVVEIVETGARTWAPEGMRFA